MSNACTICHGPRVDFDVHGERVCAACEPLAEANQINDWVEREVAWGAWEGGPSGRVVLHELRLIGHGTAPFDPADATITEHPIPGGVETYEVEYAPQFDREGCWFGPDDWCEGEATREERLAALRRMAQREVRRR